MMVGNTNKTKEFSVHYSNFLAVYFMVNKRVGTDFECCLNYCN